MLKVAFVEVPVPDKKARRRHVALGLASVAIAPVVVFAALWTLLLATLGVMWLANAVGAL